MSPSMHRLPRINSWKGGSPPVRNPHTDWRDIKISIYMLRERYGYDWYPLHKNVPVRVTASYAEKMMDLPPGSVETFSRLCGPHVHGQPTRLRSMKSVRPQLGRKRGGGNLVPLVERPVGWETWIRMTPRDELRPDQVERIAKRDALEAERDRLTPKYDVTPEEWAELERKSEFSNLPLWKQKKVKETEDLKRRIQEWKDKWAEIDAEEARKAAEAEEWAEREREAVKLHLERKKRAPIIGRTKAKMKREGKL